MLIPFLKGVVYCFKGLRWLTHPRLRRFVIMPLLINTVLFATAIGWGASEFSLLIDVLLAQLPRWLDWLRWLLWPLFALTTLIVCFYTFALVANLIASPFNGLLAERVEDLAVPGQWRPKNQPLWREIALTPVTELKKLAYFVLWTIPLLMLFIVPVLNAAAPLLWFTFSAWLLALQYSDYPLSNHGLSFTVQRQLLRRQRSLLLGFGSAVLLLTLVPVINFFAMPAAVIGATLLWVDSNPLQQGERDNGPWRPQARAGPVDGGVKPLCLFASARDQCLHRRRVETVAYRWRER
jgi:CysZ protein